jgi:hypothetical protein
VISLILAGLICVYAGWFRQACLVSFLAGVIVAVVSWTFVGMLSLLEPGFGVLFMVPFALLVILPTVIAGFVIGKIVFTMTHRADKGAESDP